MLRYRRARIDSRTCRAEVTRQRLRARAAVQTLDEQYRAMPALPLSLAAIGGLVLGRRDSKWRPPRRVWVLARRWGLHVLRGLLL